MLLVDMINTNNPKLHLPLSIDQDISCYDLHNILKYVYYLFHIVIILLIPLLINTGYFYNKIMSADHIKK